MRRFLIVGLALGASGCAADLERATRPLEAALGHEAAPRPLGSEGNPVRAWMPPGERDYLRRLRCSDGRAPTSQRIGSAGLSPAGNIMDAYQVTCAGASPASEVVYIDMYHEGHVEAAAPRGFGIVAPR